MSQFSFSSIWFFTTLFISLFSMNANSQLTCRHFNALPDTNFWATDSIQNKGIHVFDRYGNKYALARMNFKYFNTNPISMGTEGSLPRPISTTCNAGMFKVHFVEELTTGYGFDNVAYRNLVCKVFQDISDMLVDVNPSNPARVNIFVASDSTFPLIRSGASFSSGELGYGSSFYTLSTPVNNVFADNVAYQTIKLGKTAYSNLPSLITPTMSDGYYHGYLAINFKGVNYNTNINTATIASNELDMYTAVLHEALHILGIASGIDDNFSSIFGNNIYTRYDENLFKNSTASKLLTHNTPQTAISNTSGLTAANQGCSTPNNFIFNGANLSGQAVFNNTTWMPGTNLSHLGCSGSGVCNSTFEQPSSDYVMNPCIGLGSAYIKRHPNSNEYKVLCDLGYELTGSYGNLSVPSIGIYTTYSTCNPPCIAVGENDVLTTDYMTPINLNSVLSNDKPSSSIISRVELFSSFDGTITNSGGNFVFTPDRYISGNVYLVYYIKCGTTGKLSSPIYITVKVKPVDIPPPPVCVDNNACNLVCHGDYEASIYSQHWSNYLIDSPELLPAENSPDIFRYDNGNMCMLSSLDGKPVYCNTLGGACYNTLKTRDTPHISGGKQYIGMGYVNYTPYFFEGVHHKLKRPMLPGKKYKLKFLARKMDINCVNPFVEFYGDSMPPCAPPLFTKRSGVSACGFNAKVLATSGAISSRDWTQYTISNISPASKITDILISPYKKFGIIEYGYVNLDNIEIFEDSITPLRITAIEFNPNPCLTGIHTGKYKICLDTSAKDSNATPIFVKLKLPKGVTMQTGSSFNTQGEYEIPTGQITSNNCFELTVRYAFDGSIKADSLYYIGLETLNTKLCASTESSHNVPIRPVSGIGNSPISIQKTISKTHPKVGDIVTITLKVCNSDTTASDTLNIVDTLSENMVLVNPNGFDVNGSELTRKTTLGISPNHCKTYTYTVYITSKSGSINCATVNSFGNNCVLDKDCIRINELIDVCLHNVRTFVSPMNPYSVITGSGYDIISYSDDTFRVKFKTKGNHLIVVHNGSNYDTFPVNVFVPQPYIAVSENLVCNSGFPPTSETSQVRISEGKCQKVCENSCVWYYAGSYSVYKDRTFKWSVSGATNISDTAIVQGDSILICWGSVGSSIRLIEESQDGCSDTTSACIEVLQSIGTADFGILPNIQDEEYHLCDQQTLNFNDISDVRNSSELESWCWEFGDGNRECGNVSLDGLPPAVFEYTYANYGTFQAKLSYTTKCGCVISKTKTIVIDTGLKLEIYCKNPVCPSEVVEYFVDSFCPPPYDWSVTNGIILGSNNTHRIQVQWGDPDDGIGLVTVNAPVGCSVCNPVQTLKVNILPTNPIVTHPESACAGESVTHTSISISSTKYGWRDLSSTGSTDSIYYQNFVVPSSLVTGSNFASYSHQMTLYNMFGQVKCSSTKSYTMKIKDTFRWTGPDTACLGVSTNYTMNPAIKSADTVEISGDGLAAPEYFFGVSSFNYTFMNSGTYTIKVKDEWLCDKGSCIKQVTVLPKINQPQAITGKTDVCIHDLETYRSSPKQLGTKYQWIIPAGDTLVNASGDYAQIEFKSAGVKRIGVVATYLSSPYCVSDTTWYTVSCATPSPVLSGDSLVCANDTSLFSVSTTNGYNYSWRLIPSTGLGSIVKLTESNVKIAWNDISVNTALTVRVEFSRCGLDTFAEKTLALLASPSPDITGKDTVCVNSSHAYSSSLVSTTPYYNWTGTGLQITGQSQSTSVSFPKTGTYTLNLFTRTGTCKALKKVSKVIRVLPLPETHISLIPPCNSQGSNTHTLKGTIAIIGNGRYRITNPNSVLSSTFSMSVSGSGIKGSYTVFDSVTGCQISVPVDYPECTDEAGTSPDIDTGTHECDAMKLMGDSVSISLSSQCGYLNYNFIPVGSFTNYYMKREHQFISANVSDVLGRYEPGKYAITFAASHGSTACFVQFDTSFEIRLKADMDASVICESNARKIFLRDKSTFIEPYTISSRNWTIKKGTTTVATGTGASYTSSALFAGTYTVYLAVSNGSGDICYDTQSVTIDSMRVSFTVDKTEICDAGVVKFTSTSPDSGKFVLYNWVFDDNTNLARKNGVKQLENTDGTNPNIPKNYSSRLEVTDYIGCKHTSYVIMTQVYFNNLLNVNKPMITLNTNNICTDQVPIGASVNALPINRSPYYYQWSHLPEFTTSYTDISTSGIYHVKVVDRYGCEGTSAPVTVQIYLDPEIQVTGKERICIGDKLDLNFDAGTANLVFNPNTGVSGNQINYQPTSPGQTTIAAIATNSAGCSDTLIQNVMVYPQPSLSLSQSTKSCRPYEVTLTATGSHPRTPLTSAYLWTHGPNRSVIDVRQGGLYWMKFTDTSGCQALDSIQVEKALRFLNFPEGCFEVCQDATNSQPIVFDLSFDRPRYDAWIWYLNDVPVASGSNSLPTNPWTINYPTAGSFKYQLKLVDKGCSIVSPPIYIVVMPQPCTPKKMAYSAPNFSINPVGDVSQTWSLYPSPATNKLFIQSNFSLKQKEIIIYSMTGVVMYRGNADAQPIHLSRFTSGVYLAQLVDGGKILGKQTFVVTKD